MFALVWRARQCLLCFSLEGEVARARGGAGPPCHAAASALCACDGAMQQQLLEPLSVGGRAACRLAPPASPPACPCAATFPFFGVQPAICDDKGRELKGGWVGGRVCCSQAAAAAGATAGLEGCEGAAVCPLLAPLPAPPHHVPTHPCPPARPCPSPAGVCEGILCIKASWPGAIRGVFGDQKVGPGAGGRGQAAGAASRPGAAAGAPHARCRQLGPAFRAPHTRSAPRLLAPPPTNTEQRFEETYFQPFPVSAGTESVRCSRASPAAAPLHAHLVRCRSCVHLCPIENGWAAAPWTTASARFDASSPLASPAPAPKRAGLLLHGRRRAARRGRLLLDHGWGLC